MGMYTELVFKARLKENIPLDVLEIIKFLFMGKERPIILPEHKFFYLPRWRFIGNSSSFYHHPKPVTSYYMSDYSQDYIFTRSDLKNYDGEIEAFLDWIDPYLDNFKGSCIGWTWYEEDEVPTLIYKKS